MSKRRNKVRLIALAACHADICCIALFGTGRRLRLQCLSLHMGMRYQTENPFLRGGRVALIGLHISVVFYYAACDFHRLAAALGNKGVGAVVVRQHAPKLAVAAVGSILRNIDAGDTLSALNRQVFTGLHVHNGVIPVVGLLQIQLLIFTVVRGINLRIGTVRHGFFLAAGCNVYCKALICRCKELIYAVRHDCVTVRQVPLLRRNPRTRPHLHICAVREVVVQVEI